MTLVPPILKKRSTTAPPILKKKSVSGQPIPNKKAPTHASIERGRANNYNRLYGNPATTMTGLPWSVRHNPTGKVRFQEPPAKPKPRPRMGTYTYVYGAPDPENEPLKGHAPAQPNTSGGSSKPQPNYRELENFPDSVKRFLDLKSGTNNALAKTGTGYSPSLADLMRQTGNTISPTESVKELLDLEALWDDVRDEIGSPVKESDSLSPSELAEAAEAFDWKARKAQLAKSTKFQLPDSSTRALKKSKIPEPPLETFQQSYRLLPHLQEKLIEDQVKKEFAAQKIIPSGIDYIKRKEELMKAAFQTGYNKSASTIFPDLVQEYNYKDLFKPRGEEDGQDYEVLRRPGYTASQLNPKRHIQTLSPPMLDPKDFKLRQRRKESIMGTVLRELDESRNQSRATDEGEIPDEAANQPPRRRTKDQEKNRQLALQALENYRLIQERQKAMIHRLPQVTVRSHGLQLGDKIPMGSEYHQMALGKSHRSHPPQPKSNLHPKDMLAFKPLELSDGKLNANATGTFSRQNPQYQTYMSHGFPPAPPPISETVFPGYGHHRQQHGVTVSAMSKNGNVLSKGTKTTTFRESSPYKPDYSDKRLK